MVAIKENNPLIELETFGQSIWLDYIRRDLITSGKLAKLINEDGLRGMTSNPSIFEQAFDKSADYEKDIHAMAVKGDSIETIYKTLSQRDVGEAADEFRSLYDKTEAQDGYVSLEVNPHLAHDTQGTLKEARHLWQTLDRPNMMIKVPATVEGLPAITQLISEGINVNVTLLFSVSRYQEVAKAYIAGLEARLAQGKSIEHIASVASFFLSRIDVLVDPLLEKIITEGQQHAALAKQLHGEVAIASAKIAYRVFQQEFTSERFKLLASKGAQVQRLLWASTSTKNPAYKDVKYVDALIGPETVNTVPVETFDAYRDHGDPALRLTEDKEKLIEAFAQLPKLGIDIDKVCQQLEIEGIDKFNKAFDQLFAILKQKSH